MSLELDKQISGPMSWLTISSKSGDRDISFIIGDINSLCNNWRTLGTPNFSLFSSQAISTSDGGLFAIR